MKTALLGFAMFIALVPAYPQSDQICGTPPPVPDTYMQGITPILNQTYNFVLVFVDFPDGRKPDGSLPTVDSDTSYFNSTTIDAVGGMGYVNINPGDPPAPSSPKRKMIRKYVYDDYWNMIFTSGTYVGSIHPDYPSHGIQVYGSMKDYYEEATYGNVHIVPYQTHSGGSDFYHIGIVNNIDAANGKKYIHWIKMQSNSTSYDYTTLSPATEAQALLASLHNLPVGNPERIEFDVTAYTNASSNNKIAFVAAGGAKGGIADMNGHIFWVAEKACDPGRKNNHPESALDGIQQYVHEFGHLLGMEHFVAGNYETMHWGGLVPWGYAEWNFYYYCPPHFSPWVKIKYGWISQSNVLKITNTTPNVSLPPINEQGKVALVAVYGDPGRGGNYDYCEYYLIEYRKREGFNRFAGGVSTPGFDGGALVWHYSNYNIFPLDGQNLIKNLGLAVANYGNGFSSIPRSPSDMFYSGHPTLDGSSTPSSNSVGNFPSGISLNSFNVSGGNLIFNVTYSNGGIPAWDNFYTTNSQLTGTVSGKTYLEKLNTSKSSLQLSSGALLCESPGCALNVTNSFAADHSSVQILEHSSLSLNGNSSTTGDLSITGTGSLSVHGAFSISGNLIVGNGVTANIASGAVLTFGGSRIFNCNGILSAAGTSGSRISMTSGSTWGGIQLNGSGSNTSNLQYVTVNNVQTYGGSALSISNATGVTVKNCNISGNVNYSTNGIYLYNAGSPDISYNTLSSNGGYGIVFSGTNGNFYANTVQGNTGGGVYCTSSSPSFGKNGFPAYNGNNIITRGSYGVYCGASYPYIGSQQSSYYGYNWIDSSTSARIYAYNSTVLAEENWWGSSNPNPSWFVVSGGSIDWQPYLQSNPFSQQRPAIDPGGNPNLMVAGIAGSTTDTVSIIRGAVESRVAGNFVQAKTLLQPLLSSAVSSQFSLRAAVELLNIFRESHDPSILTFCQSFLQQSRSNDPILQLIVAEMLGVQSRIPEASSLYKSVASNYAGTDWGKHALIGLYYLYATNSGFRALAADVANDLKSKYGTDPDIMQALWVNQSQQGGGQVQPKPSLPATSTNSIPMSFALLENYPNPFNPATTMNYSLPVAGAVTLEIYDILGQKVVGLVNGQHEAGNYSSTWNGRNEVGASVASGVYLARLSVTDALGILVFTKTNKLLLMK